MNGGYAQYTATGLYGPGEQMAAAYGVAVPVAGAAVDDGNGQAWNAVPRDFWRSSGFGLILLIALVVYFDIRLLNR